MSQLIENVRAHIEKNNLMLALRVLDDALETQDTSPDTRLLRAYARQLAGDLWGALGDLRAAQEAGHDIDYRLEAELLASLGWQTQAFEGLLSALERGKINASSLLGIGGRRADLLAIEKSSPTAMHEQTSTVFVHLLSLGEYELARETLQKAPTGHLAYLTELLDGIERCDALHPSATKNLERGKQLTGKLQGVRGWLSLDEAHLIHELVEQRREHTHAVEVGAFHGRSTIAGALANKTRRDKGTPLPLWSVDTHAGMQAYGPADSQSMLRDHLSERGLSSEVEMVCQESTLAAKTFEGAVGFLFIDAGHDYSSVKADIDAWSKHLIQGAYVLFHDSFMSGVCAALSELLLSSSAFKPLGLRDSTFVMRYDSSGKSISDEERSVWLRLLNRLNCDFVLWEQAQRDEKRARFVSKLVAQTIEPSISKLTAPISKA